jgi:hypothetical protein
MPPFACFDAASKGTIEAFMAIPYYWPAKEAALEWFATVPFGMNAEGMAAWYHQGDGLKLWEEAYAAFNLVPRPAFASAPHMAGWFRKKIGTIADYKGLKMRIGTGLGGKVYARAGGASVLTPGAEVYAALERGVIDAAEWVGPYDDMKLGLHDARASAADREWLTNVYPFYLHDLSEFDEHYYTLNDRGLWEPDHLPSWLQDDTDHPLIIRQSETRVGFALVNEAPSDAGIPLSIGGILHPEEVSSYRDRPSCGASSLRSVSGTVAVEHIGSQRPGDRVLAQSPRRSSQPPGGIGTLSRTRLRFRHRSGKGR